MNGRQLQIRVSGLGGLVVVSLASTHFVVLSGKSPR